MIQFKEGEKEDGKEVAELLLESYNIESLEKAEKAFLEEIDHYNYIIAREGNEILGFVTWIRHGLHKHGLAELDRIAVAKKHRRKGIASKLFKELIRKAKEEYAKNNSKLRKLFLFTHADNKKAQKFYKGMSMEKEATLKDHFYKGKDELVMSIFF